MQTRYNYVIDVWIRQAEKDRRLQVHNSLALIYLSDNQPTLDLSKLYNRLQKFLENQIRVKEQLWRKSEDKHLILHLFPNEIVFMFKFFGGQFSGTFWLWRKGRGSLHGNEPSRHLWLASPPLKGFLIWTFLNIYPNISNYVLRFTGVLLFAQLEWNENWCCLDFCGDNQPIKQPTR